MIRYIRILYFHVAALLMDMERFDELGRHLERCLRVRTIDKSWVYGRYAMAEELQGKNFEQGDILFREGDPGESE